MQQSAAAAHEQPHAAAVAALRATLRSGDCCPAFGQEGVTLRPAGVAPPGAEGESSEPPGVLLLLRRGAASGAGAADHLVAWVAASELATLAPQLLSTSTLNACRAAAETADAESSAAAAAPRGRYALTAATPQPLVWELVRLRAVQRKSTLRGARLARLEGDCCRTTASGAPDSDSEAGSVSPPPACAVCATAADAAGPGPVPGSPVVKGGGGVVAELCFGEGGLQQFLDVLGAVVKLIPSPVLPDRFAVVVPPPPARPVLAASSAVSRKATEGDAGSDAESRDAVDAVEAAAAAIVTTVEEDAVAAVAAVRERFRDARQHGWTKTAATIGVGVGAALAGAAAAWAATKALDSPVDRAEGDRSEDDRDQVDRGDEVAGSGFAVVQRMPTDVEDVVPDMPAAEVVERVLGPRLTAEQWLSCFGRAPAAQECETAAAGSPPPFSLLVPGVHGAPDAELLAAAREVAFRGGVDPRARYDVWATVLGVYTGAQSAAERLEMDQRNRERYHRIKGQWCAVDAEQAASFREFRDRKVSIEKDVARTDRHLPAFATDGSPWLRRLHDVLMTFAFDHFDIGYCQGMSDLCAVPLLLCHGDEARTFTLFRALMRQRAAGNFYDDERHSMNWQLGQLSRLLEKHHSALHTQLKRRHASDMMFCFRWLLVYFKRELRCRPPGGQTPVSPALSPSDGRAAAPGGCVLGDGEPEDGGDAGPSGAADERETLPIDEVSAAALEEVGRLWDVLFCSPVPQFELFVAAGLLRQLAPQIVAFDMEADDLLKFANSVKGRAAAEDLAALGLQMHAIVAERLVLAGIDAETARLPTVAQAIRMN